MLGEAGEVEGAEAEEEVAAAASSERSEEQQALVRPNRFWINVALTVLVVVTLIVGIAPSQVIFMIALVLALIINYPGLQAQQERVDAHARGAILMASTLLAAGAFLGILEESGMIDGMAQAAAGALPTALAPLFPIIVGVVAVPMSLLFGPDPYYFGVLPVLIGVAEQFGISPEVMAQASIIGEETVGFPISPLTGSFYLLVGLAGVQIGDHIRHMLPWAWLVSLIMLAVAVISGVIPIWAT